MNAPEIAISVLADAWTTQCPEAETLCRQAVLIALTDGCADDPDLPLDRLEVSLVLADDAELQRLNHAYRGFDKPTNVLSFAALDDVEVIPPEGPILLGDVIVALETAIREAQQEDKSLSDHVRHLVVHGVLHLLGFDHQEADEAEVMEERERQILAHLGVADPYAATLPMENSERS